MTESTTTSGSCNDNGYRMPNAGDCEAASGGGDNWGGQNAWTQYPYGCWVWSTGKYYYNIPTSGSGQTNDNARYACGCMADGSFIPPWAPPPSPSPPPSCYRRLEQPMDTETCATYGFTKATSVECEQAASELLDL